MNAEKHKSIDRAKKEHKWFTMYRCPYCKRVLAIGELFGIIKCKKCGKVLNVENLI